MRYAITDFDGNTPLLQAAQPRKGIDRFTALQKLKERINAGTLIIKRVPSKIKMIPLATKSVASNTLITTYEEVFSDGNADIAFDLLGTTRTEFGLTIFRVLQENSHLDLVKKIIPEMMSQILFGYLPCPTSECKDLLETYKKKQNNFLSVYKTMLKQVGITENNIPPSQLLSLLRNAEKFKTNDTPKHSDTLAEAISQQDKAFSAAQHYLSDTRIVHFYLQKIVETNIQIGYNSLLIYAHLKGLPIDIWSKDQNNSLNLIESAPSSVGQKLNKISIVLKSGFTQFNLLVPTSSILEENSESNTMLVLEKIHAPLQETNVYGHNLLHRAVRSIAADILVPFLLEDIQFKTIIDKADNIGKTALQRAIRYFADFKGEIIKELTEQDIKFIQIAKACLEALLKAGADINKQDTQGDSPLHRAKSLASYYVTDDNSGFQLNEWLTDLFLENLLKPDTTPHQEKITTPDQETNKVVRNDLKISTLHLPANHILSTSTSFFKAPASPIRNVPGKQATKPDPRHSSTNEPENKKKKSTFASPVKNDRQVNKKQKVLDTWTPTELTIDLTLTNTSSVENHIRVIPPNTVSPREIFKNNPQLIAFDKSQAEIEDEISENQKFNPYN